MSAAILRGLVGAVKKTRKSINVSVESTFEEHLEFCKLSKDEKLYEIAMFVYNNIQKQDVLKLPGKKERNVFKGEDFTNLLILNKFAIDQNEAKRWGQELFLRNFIHELKNKSGFKNDKTLFRFCYDEEWNRQGEGINLLFLYYF